MGFYSPNTTEGTLRPSTCSEDSMESVLLPYFRILLKLALKKGGKNPNGINSDTNSDNP